MNHTPGTTAMPGESLFHARDWANNRQAASRKAMRVVIQRVSEASVHVNGECTGRIGLGLVVLLGIATDDTQSDADYLSEKILGLRIFPDQAGKFSHSVREVGG